MKKLTSLLLAVALVFCAAIVPMSALAADEAAFSVTVDNATPAVGDTITVTVAFTACPANINTLELIVPIDTEAFEVVGTAPTYDLQKNAGTTGGSSFRAGGSEAFINFVDIAEALTASSTTVMTFQLKVKGSGTLAISEGDSFLVDENTGDDILWSATSAEVKVGGGAVVEPTPTPVVTVAPTATPVVTVAPTVAPTATPVVTVKPTVKPTVAPTATPAAPTATPAAPTANPTIPTNGEVEPPKSGDSTMMVVLASVLVLSAVAATAVAFKKN